MIDMNIPIFWYYVSKEGKPAFIIATTECSNEEFSEYFKHSIAEKHSIIEYNHTKYKHVLHVSTKKCVCSNPEQWKDLNLQIVLFVDEACHDYDDISKDDIIKSSGCVYIFEQIVQSHLMVSYMRLDEQDLFIYGGNEL